MGRPQADPIDIREKGANDQRSDRRLFMQLLAFTDCHDVQPVIASLRHEKLSAVVYEDVNDPLGIAVLMLAEDPAFFVDRLRPMIKSSPLSDLKPLPEYTMLGRTYAIGYEPDLDETLITRPTRTALNPDWPWAVWYPLRRQGRYEQLSPEEQRSILMEHGRIGMSFGQQDLAHDIRLACHGLDKHDNDFVVGLVGKELAPLSILVQTMRKTLQTSQYIEKLGPFFVGRAVWQAAMPK